MPAAPLLPNEGERLAALGELAILDTPRSPEFDVYPALAAKAFAAPSAAISLIDKDRQWVKASVGMDMTEIDRSVSICAHAILHRDKALYVPDATKDRRFASNPFVTAPSGLRFYAGFPIVGPSGHALGTLCVFDSQPREVKHSSLDTLKELATGVNSAIKLHAADRATQKAATREKESRTLFAATFARIAAPVALVASSGEFVTTNPAFQQLVGYSPEELRSLRTDDLTPPEYKKVSQAAQAKQFQDGQRYELAYETFAKGGKRVAVRLTSALLVDGNARMRVVTLIPAAPAAPASPVPTLTNRDAGELRAVSLEAFRSLFGSNWERIAERALMRAEQIVRRRLGRDDVVSRVDDKFVIWFQSRDRDKNEETLNKIVRDIRIQFTTEFGAQAADHVGAVLVPSGKTPSGTPASAAPPAARADRVAAVGWLT